MIFIYLCGYEILHDHACYTVWRIIFGGANFREKSKPAFRINFNFRDYHPNHRCLNEWAALRGCMIPSDRFQIEAKSEELTNCCSNSIDAGYSSLLLRCEGEIWFIRISPFLLASSDKLHLFSEDARNSHRERRALAGPWSRGRHRRAQPSQTRSATPNYTISWSTLAKKSNIRAIWVAMQSTTPTKAP